MAWHVIFILALVQGITEFLPVSSSAHLSLLPLLFGIPENGEAQEVALHFATLLTVLIVFWPHVWQMIQGLFHFKAAWQKTYGQLIINLIVAMLPLIIIGFIVHKFFAKEVRVSNIIGFSSVIGGALMVFADLKGPQTKKLMDLSWKNALFIGVFQAFSVIPGASRLGMTLVGARLLGLKRRDALEWSFLLSIPAVIAAVTLVSLDLPWQNYSTAFYQEMGTMLALTFVIGLITLRLFLKHIARLPLWTFGIYRILLGVLVLSMR